MQQSNFTNKLIDQQVLPTGHTIMESLGISTGFQLSIYDDYKELGCYECLYCHKKLRDEDPSFEKHIMGHCIYHPDAHLKFNTDQRSSGNPTRFIPRKLGVHSDLSVIWPTDVPHKHTLQEPAATEHVVRLYDNFGSMALDVHARELPNEQLKQGPEPEPEHDDPDQQYAVPVPPSDESTRFNNKPDDLRIKHIIRHWASLPTDNPGRGQFFFPCFMCGEKRGGHMLMPCGHGPVGAPCFMKFVDDEINVCPKCTVQVEYAILSPNTFEQNDWMNLS